MPRIRNSVASAPRSTTPPMSGSGPFQLRCGRSESVFGGLVLAGLALDRRRRRREHQVDVLFDFVGERLERDHAVLARPSPTRARRHAIRPRRAASRRNWLRASASRANPPPAPRRRGRHCRPRDRNAGRSRPRPRSRPEPARVPALVCLHLRSLMLTKASGLGKTTSPRNKRAVVLGIEPGHRRARIARQLSGSGIVPCRKDIACQRLLKDPWSAASSAAR